MSLICIKWIGFVGQNSQHALLQDFPKRQLFSLLRISNIMADLSPGIYPQTPCFFARLHFFGES